MLTLRAAAALLAHADSAVALRPIARALQFAGPPHSASPDAQRTIGIRELVSHADITRGLGAIRLLSVVLAPHTGVPTTTHTRELIRRLGAALARNAPTRRWCILALDHSGSTLTLATVTPHPNGPRLAVLHVQRTHIVDSDAETIRALASVTESDDQLRHARFTDILKRDALSNRFYLGLQHTVAQLATTATGTASHEERIELALLCSSRCLFLAFLEAKGWLDNDRHFMLHQTSATLEAGGQLHHRLLRPLFFGTLNTPRSKRAPAARAFGHVPFLNGGLFAPTPLERKRHQLRFTDDALVHLIGELLDRYRFTAHEDSATWSEAAVDPEMLGRAFECLMAHDERRRSGSFYTPPALVDQIVRDALHCALPGLPEDACSPSTAPLHLDAGTRQQLATLRIIDPACGSGAFLVRTLETIADILRRSGDERPLHILRRETLTRAIFGVDRNPIAVWLCELRLWLSVVIECPETRASLVPPLPNLDHHIRVGDTLAGGDFLHAPHSARTLTALRDRYTRASGRRKQTLADALDTEERVRAVAETNSRLNAVTRERCALIESLRTKDLFGHHRPRTRLDAARLVDLRARARDIARHRTALQLGAALPFRFAAHFADVAAAGGFGMVVGNPPWVRPHALPLAERLRLRKEFRTLRHAAWTTGAKRAGASAGFAAQADLAAAFIERSTALLAPGGTLALLVPAKLWRALAGGGTRHFLATHTHIHTIRDWSDAPALFDAATYPSLIVAQRATAVTSHTSAFDTPAIDASFDAPRTTLQPPATHAVHVALTRATRTHRFAVPADHLPLAAESGAPWILLPHAALHAFERLRRAGPPLGDSPLGRPTLGVKCGCNAAFLVHAVEHDDDTASVTADDRTGIIERALLRPALRGDGIGDPLRRRRTTPIAVANSVPSTTEGGDELVSPAPGNELRILWTHAPDGAPLRTLPPRTARWLGHWRKQLEARRDSRTRTPWWSLFRTDAARHQAPRLVWADIGKELRTRVLPAGDPTVPLNSCYVLRTPSIEDAWAINALLRSPICRAWLNCIAEPARGGFRRYLGWTVACLPIPPDWPSARVPLAELGQRLASRQGVANDEQIDIVADAYGVPVSSLIPLLEWDSQ